MRIFLLSLVSICFTTALCQAQTLPPIALKYSSYAVSESGTIVGYYGTNHRIELKSTGSVSKYVIYALVATEDREFYNHAGVSLKGLGRAIWKTLTGSTQGGSTLTMQLAKNLFLSSERTVSRKLAEIEYARELEKKYSKDQLLLFYLNSMYFGNGAYGIVAAAQEYFAKSPDQLTITESACLVGLLQAPSRYNPSKNPTLALHRRNEVLHNLLEVGKLSIEEYNHLKNEPLGLTLRGNHGRFFSEQIRREAADIVGKLGLSLENDGLKIVTTLDIDVQRSAEKAIQEQWKLFPSSMKNAQIGLVSVDVRDGAIRAMVGGNEQSAASGLNRAVQIQRQPGSAFKPFLYGSLLEQGYPLATPIMDAPIVIDSGSANEWRPMNDDGKSSGVHVPMKFGLMHSLNLVAAHAMVELTSSQYVADFAHRMGITSGLFPYPSLALGTSEVSPLEMATAFSVFPGMGVRKKPFSIIRIEDRNKRLLFKATPDTMTVLDSATCFLLTDALQSVVDSGTAVSVRTFYSGPAAGKTGTTQQYSDAWFVGYTPELSTAIWVGFDTPVRKLSGSFRYGGSTAAPIWGRMMELVASKQPNRRTKLFSLPSGISYISLCTKTSMQACMDCPQTEVYPVASSLRPKECHAHCDSGFFDW